MTTQSGGQQSVGATTQACPHDECPPPPPQRVRAALFFDGTGNNRTNVAHRDTSHISAVDRATGMDASYGSGESNVSKGEKFVGPYADVTSQFHYYVEGIGTQNMARDVPQGMIEGRGGTGVKAKVRRGVDKLLRDLLALDRSRPVEFVHIDTFGFSRGAAAARYCCHVVLNDARRQIRSRMEAAGFTVGEVKVKFVGLYDTVSSYGFNHNDDVGELKLDAISNAEFVYQLAAGDEHRENFQLTLIETAGDGEQVFLPGVHSDIGGGYNDGDGETDWEVFDLDPSVFTSTLQRDRAAVRRGRQWLIDKGWYTDGELTQPNMWWEVHATRNSIDNKYSRLPLNMMAEKGREKGVNFRGSIAFRHRVPSTSSVQQAKQAIDATIAAGNTAKGGAWARYWLHREDGWLKQLRHDYCHMSSRYNGVGHAPNWTSDPLNGERRRGIISDAAG